MPWNTSARWYDARRAQNRKPATYTCPLCNRQLPSLMDHMLLFPEGDHSKRRHAHSACVIKAREAGKLPTKSEWQRAQREAERRRAAASGEVIAPNGLVAAIKRVLRGPRGGSRQA